MYFDEAFAVKYTVNIAGANIVISIDARNKKVTLSHSCVKFSFQILDKSSTWATIILDGS
jgi:Cu/Ag efflux protein CusF